MTPASAIRRAVKQRLAQRLAAFSFCLAGALLLAADVPQPAPAEKPPAEAVPANGAPPPTPSVGRLIRVALPITGNTETQIRRAVGRALAEMRAGDTRPILVLEFDAAENKTGQGSNFGGALDLARYLSRLSDAKTVAYIPRALKGHAVLAAMACEEIVMAPGATIGEAGLDEPADEPIAPLVKAGYSEIANRRRTIPAEVALAMLDKQLEVLKVETEVSPLFVLRTELPEVKKRHTIQAEEPLSQPGRLADFSGRDARRLGFVKYLAPDRTALARALSLAPRMLDDDPSLAGEWRPVRIAIKGPINAQVAARVQRTIEDQIRDQRVNFVCLWIDSPGGSLIDSMTLANFLADLDRSQVRTVAYVPSEARGDAALVALACDQLVMNHDATLGGPGAEEFSAEEIQLAREMLRDRIAPKKSRTWSLLDALVDPEARVYEYTNKKDGAVEYFGEAELAAQADPDAWTQGDEVTHAGKPLKTAGDQAVTLGLARGAVADFTGFKQLYGLEQDPVLAEPGWAHYLVDALASPALAWLLLLIGGAALYAELQAPGIGIGGFIAGVCFLLYFWSKYLGGTADWLEVLLFAAGVCCILLEMFVLPGVAIFGLGGGIMIIASLVLASQTFVLPHNEYQLAQLRDSLLSLIGVFAGVIALAIVMRRYLPYSPFFSHVMLAPPSGAELEDLEHRESLVDFEHLLGHSGVASTQLTPSGKARFEGQLVDVIADGEVIDRGTEVVVVEVQGNRVLVRSAGGSA